MESTSIESVKVGDKVWLGSWKWNPGGTYSPNRLGCKTVDRVTAAQFYLQGNPTRYRKSNGKPVNGNTVLSVLSIATPEEITAWEAEQAQKKADREAEEAVRQREQEESMARAGRLHDKLIASLPVFSIKDQFLTGSTITFRFEGHRYQITEIED